MTMSQTQLKKWFSSLKEELETAYLKNEKPWERSGFYISENAWVACRKPIADCVEKSGSFLDIGCANGYLLECVLRWTAEKGLVAIPYGIDLSEKLVNLAKKRLPKYSENFCTGNGFFWKNPVKFDYIRTELVYVPDDYRQQYLGRIIALYLTEDGKLLVTQYRNRKESVETPWFDRILRGWGFNITGKISGYLDNEELTRVFIIEK